MSSRQLLSLEKFSPPLRLPTGRARGARRRRRDAEPDRAGRWGASSANRARQDDRCAHSSCLLRRPARIVSGRMIEGETWSTVGRRDAPRARKRIAMILQDPMASLNPLSRSAIRSATDRVHEGASRAQRLATRGGLLKSVRIASGNPVTQFRTNVGRHAPGIVAPSAFPANASLDRRRADHQPRLTSSATSTCARPAARARLALSSSPKSRHPSPRCADPARRYVCRGWWSRGPCRDF